MHNEGITLKLSVAPLPALVFLIIFAGGIVNEEICINAFRQLYLYSHIDIHAYSGVFCVCAMRIFFVDFCSIGLKCNSSDGLEHPHALVLYIYTSSKFCVYPLYPESYDLYTLRI